MSLMSSLGRFRHGRYCDAGRCLLGQSQSLGQGATWIAEREVFGLENLVRGDLYTANLWATSTGSSQKTSNPSDVRLLVHVMYCYVILCHTIRSPSCCGALAAGPSVPPLDVDLYFFQSGPGLNRLTLMVRRRDCCPSM